MSTKSLSQLLEAIDTSEEPMAEHQIHSQIAASDEGNDSLSKRAELFAFSVGEGETSDWGGFYSPFLGSNIDSLDVEYFEYWKRRASETGNPLLKARYSGLVWELENRVTSVKPVHEYATAHIEGLIDAVTTGRCLYPVHEVTKIRRAVTLATSHGLKDLQRKAMLSAVELERKYSQNQQVSMCGFTLRLLLDSDVGSILTEPETEQLLSVVENAFQFLLDNKDVEGTKVVGMRLAKYFKAHEHSEQALDVVKAIGENVISAVENFEEIAKSHQYQMIHDIYREFEYSEGLDEVKRLIYEQRESLTASLHTEEIESFVSDDDMETFLSNLVDKDLDQSLVRIAVEFVERKERVEKQLLENHQESPLSGIFNKQLLGPDGIPIVTLGPVLEDFERHTMLQIADNMRYTSVFLRLALLRLAEVHPPIVENLLSYIMKSQIFHDDSEPILRAGIEAVFSDQPIVANHLLIPQIEAALRRCISILGGTILKPNMSIGFMYKTLGALLDDPIVEKVYNKDIVTNMKGVLVDSIGWNLRNDLSHGINPSVFFHHQASDRVLHIILVLALAGRQGAQSTAE